MVNNVIEVGTALIYPDVSLEGPSETLVDLVKDALLERVDLATRIPVGSCVFDPLITCTGLR